MCREIETVCKSSGRGSVCVFRERETEREKERERER